MKLDNLRQLVKEELKRALNEEINYAPGGWSNDVEKPWMSLPPGEYEVTYRPMLPLGVDRTYTLDLPDGKEFDSYDAARSYYYSNQPVYFNIRDRMKNLVKVTKIS